MDNNTLINDKVYINLSNKPIKDVFDYHFNLTVQKLMEYKLGEKMLILNSTDYNYTITDSVTIDKVPFIKHVKKTWNDFKKQYPKNTLGLHIPYDTLESNVGELIGRDFIETMTYPTYIISNTCSGSLLGIDDMNKMKKKLFIRNFIT